MRRKSRGTKTIAASSPAELGIEGILAKIHEQLVNLEKKIDGLAGRVSVIPQPAQIFDSAQNRPPQPQPRKERVMYETICADCNKMCEVPFRPSGNRPVYCKPCFAKRKQNNGLFKPAETRPGPAPSITPAPAITIKPAKPGGKKKPGSKKKHGK